MRRLVGVIAPAIALIAFAGCGRSEKRTSHTRSTSSAVTSSAVQSAAATPQYVLQPSASVAPAAPVFTAVDPMAYVGSTDVLPARPFLYSVDATGITITRFNDNKVVGAWPWPESIWIELPDGSIQEIPKPSGGWEPVGMTVSYPTETELANRVKEIPDLTPPWTFVYVVMARSGYEWRSSGGDPALLRNPNVRDTLVPSTTPETESSILVQIDVSDPSFSTSLDPVAPSEPHIAGAILGHGAGQPVYDRSTGNVYVGNLPSTSLPARLTSFVSVIHRIPPTVTATEAEIPGLSKPVIRCGPQHPEVGIPVGMPQAYACYDPSGAHPINDNEHVGAFGDFEWEFKDLPPWLTAHADKVTGKLDGILYGTPTETKEWYAQARVHNLGDPYGVFSDWTPIRLLVTPTAEYLPIKAQFAAGVPVAYPIAGTGACGLVGAPVWADVAEVPNGCVVMGRAPISGEHYEFAMPGFTEQGYITPIFSGNVVGAYGFDPLPEGVGISGLAWHQISKAADPSTETPVLSLELIGVDPSTGWLYRILQPPGQPQPPNERPAETAIAIDTVTAMGVDLGAALAAARSDVAGHLIRFGEVAVEADRDIFVAAVTDSTVSGAVMKVGGGTIKTIDLPGVQASSLGLDSDLRTAIPGVEPGQVDNGALWVTGATGNVAVIDTAAGTLAQTLAVAGASSLGSVSVDFGTRWAYVAGGSSQTVAIFAPEGSVGRPPMAPRIWSTEEITWNRGYPGPTAAPPGVVAYQMMATGDPLPTLSRLGDLPDGLTWVDNGDGTASVSGMPGPTTEGDYPFAFTATNTTGTYAQALGMSVNTPAAITSPATVTFVAGAASSFTVTGTGYPTPIFYTWDEALLPIGVELVDNENGTASLVGTPETDGTYEFTLNATTGCGADAAQTFKLVVDAAGSMRAPEITSPAAFTWEALGAPFAPDPFTVTSTGSPTPTLTISGELPFGANFIDNGDSTGTLGSGCRVVWPGWQPECLAALFEGTTPGPYTFTITATNDAGIATQTFTLDVETATSIMTPPPTAPAMLSFAYTSGGSLPPAQPLAIGTLGDTMPYAAVTTASWLHVTPVSGTIPRELTVSVDPTGLLPGTYTGTVLVTSAGTDGPFATALVTFTVSGVPLLGITPETLIFEHAVSAGATPPAQTVSLTSGGVPLSYTVSSSASWLVATPTTGTTPASITLSVDDSGLDFGTYVGCVTITSAGAANGPQKIVVTLFKSATGRTDPTVKVFFDVGSGPEGLAVNRTTHQLFIGTGNEAAAEAAGGDTEVPAPPDPAAGYAVFRFDPATGQVVGHTLVHSEGEYVAVNSTTGRVYHGSQGTGEVAVIDGLQDKVLGFVSLTTSEGPYTPYQIAIDEEQDLIYVGAHAPPIPDPIPVPGKPFACKAIHEMPDDEYDCWNPGRVFVIDGQTNKVVGSFLAGDDPEGVVFAAATGKVYASNEDDGSVTVAERAYRNGDGSIAAPRVLGTIIRGVRVPGTWHPTCDANNYCGERGQAALWPKRSRCNGIDDEAEEADKMTVDPEGNVYIIDDRYRVAKIDGCTDKVEKVLELEGFDCEAENSSDVTFRNMANNIAFSPGGVIPTPAFGPTGLGMPFDLDQPFRIGCEQGCELPATLYVTSEQDTVSLIDPSSMTLMQIVTIPGASELDAIATDPALNRVFITDEGVGALFVLEGGGCINPLPSDGGGDNGGGDNGGGDNGGGDNGGGDNGGGDNGGSTPGGGGHHHGGCSSGGLADASLLSLGIAMLALRRRRPRVG